MIRTETLCTGNDAVELITIETPGLGNRSYVAIADNWAVGVDLQRDVDRVHALLTERGARLAAVVETHIHNDYVTGGYALARELDAAYVVPDGPAVAFKARRGNHGDVIEAGPLVLRVINSPGHTDAHSSYSLHVGDDPALAAFTGGSLLLGGTGRSDLLGEDRFVELATQQYWTARRLARILPNDTRLLPTHGFGSHCLAGEAAVCTSDRLAEQLDINPAYLLDEESFVQDMLSRLGPIPGYFPKMAPRNLAGPTAADLSPMTRLPLSVVAARAAGGEQVVDVRARHQFADGHLPGSVSVDATGSVATWIGWTNDIDAPVTLVADDLEQLAQVQRELRRIGVEQLCGYAGPLVGVRLASTTTATFPEVARRLRGRAEITFVDVRDPAEWRSGHIKGAIHMPAYSLGAMPPNAHLYCGVGFRASIAGSVLERQGTEVTVVDDAVTRAKRAGIPWCDGRECGDHRCNAALVAAR